MNNLYNFVSFVSFLWAIKSAHLLLKSSKKNVSVYRMLYLFIVLCALVNMVLNTLVYVALVIVVIIVIVVSLRFLLNAVFILPVTVEHESLIKYIMPIHLPIWLFSKLHQLKPLKLIIHNRWEEFIVWMNNNKFPTSCFCCAILYYII